MGYRRCDSNKQAGQSLKLANRTNSSTLPKHAFKAKNEAELLNQGFANTGSIHLLSKDRGAFRLLHKTTKKALGEIKEG